VSLVILTGWAGQISLGHWAIVGFGAATTGILMSRHGVDLFLALPAGAVAGGLVSLVIGLPALRIGGLYLAVTTLAFAVTSGRLHDVGRHRRLRRWPLRAPPARPQHRLFWCRRQRAPVLDGGDRWIGVAAGGHSRCDVRARRRVLPQGRLVVAGQRDRDPFPL